MREIFKHGGRRLIARKSLDNVMQDGAASVFSRTLGPWHLLLLGVGSTVGAGIYVMTGTAAATFAGPAVLISFVIAGIACGFAALCYAELASALPVAGSSYTYAYVALGEVFAWTMGWLLLLELGVAGSTVAAGFAGYMVSALGSLGLVVPEAISTPLVQATMVDGQLAFSVGSSVNLIAAAGVAAVAVPLVIGISASALINSVITFLKIVILLVFVAIGISHVVPVNWQPFIPDNQGEFAFGWPGIFRAASVIFFAYIGFETVSTAAAEARNPQRDLPIGILGSLLICTILYLIVAATLTGIVPYRELGVADPLAAAAEVIGEPWLVLFITIGATIGLTSIMLSTAYGQSRVFYAMARDGLLPQVFTRIHSRFRTPWLGTIMITIGMATAAALLPIALLGDLVSIGTATSFCIVCFTVLWLRHREPELPRPFRVPLGGISVAGVWVGIVPVLGIVSCLLMIVPVVIDIGVKAANGNRIPALLLLTYFAIGAALYAGYGFRHSRLAIARRQRAGLASPNAIAPTRAAERNDSADRHGGAF